MRIRYIKPGYFTNEVLAALHPLTRILFAGLWCAADKEGRLEDRPARIKATILPFDEHDIDGALDDLQRAGFIVRYANDGQRLIQIITWALHQRPHNHESPSIIPPPSKRKKTDKLERITGMGMGTGTGTGRKTRTPRQLTLGPPAAVALPPASEPTTAAGQPPPIPEPADASETPPGQVVIYRHWEERLAKPHLDRLPPEAWSILGARLREGMTVPMGCAVVDGAAIDAERWPERKTNDGLRYLFGSMDQVLKFADLAAKGNPKPAVDIEKIRRGNQRAEDQGWEDVEKRPVTRKAIT